MSKNRTVEANFTIVGGPHHGTKIPESNGLKPVSITSASRHHKPLEHVPMRFVVGDTESIVTVFSPPDIFEVFVTDFLNGKYEDHHMRDYDILQDKVYPPKKIELKRIEN